jgi:hypothetical protein
MKRGSTSPTDRHLQDSLARPGRRRATSDCIVAEADELETTTSLARVAATEMLQDHLDEFHGRSEVNHCGQNTSRYPNTPWTNASGTCAPLSRNSLDGWDCGEQYPTSDSDSSEGSAGIGFMDSTVYTVPGFDGPLTPTSIEGGRPGSGDEDNSSAPLSTGSRNRTSTGPSIREQPAFID